MARDPPRLRLAAPRARADPGRLRVPPGSRAHFHQSRSRRPPRAPAHRAAAFGGGYYGSKLGAQAAVQREFRIATRAWLVAQPDYPAGLARPCRSRTVRPRAEPGAARLHRDRLRAPGPPGALASGPPCRAGGPPVPGPGGVARLFRTVEGATDRSGHPAGGNNDLKAPIYKGGAIPPGPTPRLPKPPSSPRSVTEGTEIAAAKPDRH